MMFKLIILSGSRKGQRVALENAAVTLGRDETCSIALEDAEVAGQHAVVEPEGAGFGIRDLGSSGGTRVNEEMVQKAKLKHGDVIQIGQSRFFVEAVRSSSGDGAAGLQILNRVLIVVAFVGAPIAFLGLVAYLEWAYLGIGESVPPADSCKPPNTTLPTNDSVRL